MKYLNPKKTNGFTVIEAMVAISILLLSIVGAFAVAQSSLRSSNLAKNRVTAYYLAQEAIEYVRQVRDSNGLDALSDRNTPVFWLKGFAETIDDPCFPGKICLVDSTGIDQPAACASGTGPCPNLLRNEQTGLFNYDELNIDNVNSIFNRSLALNYVCHEGMCDNEVTVSVTVSWDQNGVEQYINVSENLYNWQQIDS